MKLGYDEVEDKEVFWNKFSSPKGDKLGFYRDVMDVVKEKLEGNEIVGELERVLGWMKEVF